LGTSGAASLPTRPYVSLYLGSSPEFWLNLQTDYELRVARAIRRMRERRREIQAEVAGVAKAV
jgi:plasmid maintenance system antidote protein VapI